MQTQPVPPRNREAGFSLLEMMAATAILALVGLIIGVSLSAFARSWQHAEQAGNLLERNQALDRVAETLLRGAVPFQWQDRDTLEQRYVFKGDVDELYLTALNRSYGGADALRFARLYRDGDRLLCDWSTTPLLPWRDLGDQKYTTEPLSGSVSEIYFRYAYEDDNGDVAWDDTWDEDEREGIPLAIQLTVEWTDGTRERWLRRTAGTSGNTALAAPSSSIGTTAGSGQGGGGNRTGGGNQGGGGGNNQGGGGNR